MKPNPPDVFATRLIELYGGREKALEALNRRFAAIDAKWDQDADTIGRILRAHLFVEHYLTEYLQLHNPNLPSLDDARLSFAKKIALLGTSDRSIAHFVEGLKRLNAVRNRLAHKLKAEVTEEDSRVFLSIGLFAAMRKALVAPDVPDDDPISVLEDFAKHAGHMLESAHSPDSKLWAQAIWGKAIFDTTLLTQPDV